MARYISRTSNSKTSSCLIRWLNEGMGDFYSCPGMNSTETKVPIYSATFFPLRENFLRKDETLCFMPSMLSSTTCEEKFFNRKGMIRRPSQPAFERSTFLINRSIAELMPRLSSGLLLSRVINLPTKPAASAAGFEL